MTINLKKIYVGYRAKEKSSSALLEQLDWFYRAADFDPKTGLALPQALSSFLKKIAQPVNNSIIHDRLWRITEHSRAALEHLMRSLNESPRREQALMPIHAVRELDANSFIKLSNRPGRTIREKLAGKPHMQAVRRFQSVDLPENRLLKAFVRHLVELLEFRLDYLGHEDEILPKIQSWLHSEEAQAIGNWDNLPPNNTLLSHRDYRRIWDAWRWLQTLDDDVAGDFVQVEARDKTMRLWRQCAQMWSSGKHLFSEMPLIFDYEKFEILPWTSKPPLFNTSRKNISRHSLQCEITDPACVDFTSLRPSYDCGDGAFAQSLPDTFLWQQWRRDDESIDIELFHSDAVWLHPQSITISGPDLLFAKGNTSENCDRAARAFTIRLHEIFRNDTLYWLVPDFLNDFELELIRRNLNARFSNAEPLPRSVAAVFALADPEKIKGEGYAVVVVDTIGNKTCAVKLLAKFDENLKKRLPITRGFYWERCPPVIIANADDNRTEFQGYDISVVDAQERWHDAIPASRSGYIDPEHLKRDRRIGGFAFCINLTGSPVAGGVRLHTLQQQAGDIPLWRDQIPELSIKVMKDGHYQRFHLVSRGTTIKPVRGKPVFIPIAEEFTLLAGKQHYSFPLYIGSNADDLGFSARLDSPDFPLKCDALCDLNLTFEYGADTPYKLEFTPRAESIRPMRATWQRMDEIVISDAPAPEYPTPITWSDLRIFPKSGSNETTDLLDWMQRGIAQLDRHLYIRPKPRITGEISSAWKIDKKGGKFTFAACDAVEDSVFIHQNSFIHGLNFVDFSEGQEISFELREREGKCSGWKVAGPTYKDAVHLKFFDKESEKDLVANIRKSLYFPVIQVWRDGRSISDPECPQDFSAAMKINCEYLVALLSEDELPESVRAEIIFLLFCMHKDVPDDCIQLIFDKIRDGNILEKSLVGFALGDVSKQWQYDLLSKLVENLTGDVLRIFSYAIWREQNFVDKICLADMRSILNTLSIMLGNIKQCPPRKYEKDEWTARNWIRSTTEPLELLLGLLRTRASSNPEIKMLLQPHQKITKEFAKQIEHVTEIILQSDIPLFSRVQLNLQKPKSDRAPDLLYALRLYLGGDDGADAIHISSVSDGNAD